MHSVLLPVFKICLLIQVFGFTCSLKSLENDDRHPNSILAKDFWTYAKKHQKTPGTFSIQTIKFLEQQKKSPSQDTEQIVFQYSKDSWSKMQANLAYRKATFVIASTANCLEGAMNRGGIKYGMQDLCSEHAVQGEDAVLSAPWSGYQRLTDTKYNLLKHRTILFDEFLKTGDYTNLKVGIHFNVPVLGCLAQPLYHNPNFENVQLELTNEPSAQLIHQILVSAVNLKSKTQDKKIGTMPDARTDLKYMIRGAILALNYGKQLELKAPPSNVIVIPFLGAGAFGNDWRWTIDALETCADLIKTLKLKVIINDFSASLDSEKYNYLKSRPGLKGITISSRAGIF